MAECRTTDSDRLAPYPNMTEDNVEESSQLYLDSQRLHGAVGIIDCPIGKGKRTPRQSNA